MARTLTETRTTLIAITTHVKSSEFSANKLDEAIRSAGEELAEFTSAIRTTTALAVGANVSVLNFQSLGITEFIIDDFIHAYIGVSTGGTVEVTPIPHSSIQRRRSNETPGEPKHLALLRNDAVLIYPSNDGTARTLDVTHRDKFVTWTLGTSSPGSVTMNLPQVLFGRFVTHCCKYYLLHGLNKFHPDVEQTYREKEKFMAYAKSMFPAREPAVDDAQSGPSRTRRKQFEQKPIL